MLVLTGPGRIVGCTVVLGVLTGSMSPQAALPLVPNAHALSFPEVQWVVLCLSVYVHFRSVQLRHVPFVTLDACSRYAPTEPRHEVGLM